MSDPYNLIRKKKANNANVVTKPAIDKLYPVGSVCYYAIPMLFEHGKWVLTSTDGGVYTYKRLPDDSMSSSMSSDYTTTAQDMQDYRKNTIFNKTGENKMTERKVVTVTLLDDDSGLPVEHAVVAIFEGVVTEDSDQVTIQQLLMDEPVKEKIDAHNTRRAEIVDNTILERTGNVVKLRPVQLKDLRWNIK